MNVCWHSSWQVCAGWQGYSIRRRYSILKRWCFNNVGNPRRNLQENIPFPGLRIWPSVTFKSPNNHPQTEGVHKIPVWKKDTPLLRLPIMQISAASIQTREKIEIQALTWCSQGNKGTLHEWTFKNPNRQAESTLGLTHQHRQQVTHLPSGVWTGMPHRSRKE